MLLDNSYIEFLSDLKSRILQSRYRAASVVVKEQLLLYLQTGKMLADKIATEKWGTKVVEKLAADLQTELPGLRGFSRRNMMLMKQFAEEYISSLKFYNNSFVNISEDNSENIDIQANIIVQSLTAQFNNTIPKATNEFENLIVQTVSAQFQSVDYHTVSSFFGLSFSHHLLLISKCKNIEERFFYMKYAFFNQLSHDQLDYQIKSKLFSKQGKLPNNFDVTLPKNLKNNALQIFKDEYLFDFINIEETEDERVFENKIVANIKKFIMSLGKGFSFIGNQYKVEIAEQEFFIDLLFYNRILQCLVAFELKRGKFKPEYAGKLNFYLNVLDENVKLQHENPSIGIILCKEKDNSVVEYSFRNINKAMGVATFQISETVPEQWKNVLPSPEELRKLL